mmetsp:Transcript_40985/g.130238  ORF Transcript_40985/g.130238 Transcript_40985/m.130238 type:complete len:199 (-) Transcript_40985:89-685(-)
MARRTARRPGAALWAAVLLCALSFTAPSFLHAGRVLRVPSTVRGCVTLQAEAQSPEFPRKRALLATALLTAGASTAEASPRVRFRSLESLAEELKAQEAKDTVFNDQGAPEKHLPKIQVTGETVEMSVAHVMDPVKPHYIEYMWLKDAKSGEVLSAKQFVDSDASPPTFSSTVAKGTTVEPVLYCNLHGLWKGEVFSV